MRSTRTRNSTRAAEPIYRFHGRQAPTPEDRVPIRAELQSPSVDDDGVATLRLYGPVDSWGEFWGVSALEFSAALDELDDDVTEIRLHINSPGGEVWEGIAILNQLRNHPARVVAIVEGIAASIASVIAVGADELIMGRNSELMIHDASTICFGNATRMRDVADRLDRSSNNIASVYAEKSGGSVEDWRSAMLAESWYSAQEAVDAGLADSVQGAADGETSDPEEIVPKNRVDLSIFQHQGRADAPAPKAVGAASPTETASTKTPSQPYLSDARTRRAQLTRP